MTTPATATASPAAAQPAAPPKPKRSESLRIGNKGEGRYIHIPFEAPKTIDEFYALFGENETFLAKMAERGVRIRIQDEFREEVSERLKKGESPDTVRNWVMDQLADLDLTVVKERATPSRKPKEVEATTAEVEQFGGADALRQFLAAKGIGLKIAGQQA
jgi:hypothetical protein